MSWSSYRSRSSGSRYGGFAPYVPVAKRRAQAAHAVAKNGAGWNPVTITGRKIAATFWGAAWCEHLESYSDYANRLPRGRTYVRNGSVVDLQITPGLITARVQGSSLYSETITIKPLAPTKWQAIKAACAGQVTSLVGLLQGKLPEAVLRVITDRVAGLFPAPAEITLGCSCPDSASLCKHLAAVLYGVGSRLDERPELLFVLRGVDPQELIAEALDVVSRGVDGESGASGGLSDGDLADVFGIDLSGAGEPKANVQPVPPASVPTASPPKAGTAKKIKVKSALEKPASAKKSTSAKKATAAKKVAPAKKKPTQNRLKKTSKAKPRP